jgi:hypothetical protein
MDRRNFDLNKFPKLERKNVDIIDGVLSHDLPAISASHAALLRAALTRRDSNAQ